MFMTQLLRFGKFSLMFFCERNLGVTWSNCIKYTHIITLIIDAPWLCLILQICCCVSKWGRLKDDCGPKSRPVFELFTPLPLEIKREMGKMYYTLFRAWCMTQAAVWSVIVNKGFPLVPQFLAKQGFLTFFGRPNYIPFVALKVVVLPSCLPIK